MEKPIRHFERCHTRFICTPIEKKEPNKRLMRVQVLDPISKRMVTKSEYRSIDRRKEMEHYTMNDFCVENLLSAGVNMQYGTLTGSHHSSVENMKRELSKINEQNS